MKNPLILLVGLFLSLSLFTGTSALGQTAQLSISTSPQAITVGAPSDLSETPLTNTVGALSHWLPGSRAHRARRGMHSPFRLQLGRTFSITVPKH